METKEIVDQIEESNEHGEKHHTDPFWRYAPLLILIAGVFAVFTHLGGSNAAKQMMISFAASSDIYNQYQAKNDRQTILRSENDLLTVLMPVLPQEAQDKATTLIDGNTKTIARYESEPDPTDPDNPHKGGGKKELLVQAQDKTDAYEHSAKQDPYFDFAEVAFGLVFIFGSSALALRWKHLMLANLAPFAVGIFLMLDGFFLFLELPFLG